ncbi:hypothetical protein [Senegalia sp. (in: firmicutes)]|uniref:hypothetical protein n=1 Tax=Senegalia sp. (in: firmicutes) TaxID=1924098 RepID=UPI003F9B40B7
MELQGKSKNIKRSFTIDEELLEKFKKTSKKECKTYKRSVEEALKIWLEYYENKKGSEIK